MHKKPAITHMKAWKSLLGTSTRTISEQSITLESWKEQGSIQEGEKKGREKRAWPREKEREDRTSVLQFHRAFFVYVCRPYWPVRFSRTKIMPYFYISQSMQRISPVTQGTQHALLKESEPLVGAGGRNRTVETSCKKY